MSKGNKALAYGVSFTPIMRIRNTSMRASATCTNISPGNPVANLAMCLLIVQLRMGDRLPLCFSNSCLKAWPVRMESVGPINIIYWQQLT